MAKVMEMEVINIGTPFCAVKGLAQCAGGDRDEVTRDRSWQVGND